MYYLLDLGHSVEELPTAFQRAMRQPARALQHGPGQQGAGLALLLVLSVLPVRGVAVRWWLIIVIYAAAKLCELADHVIYEATGQLISGHSLKHLVAAFAAWPVIRALKALGQNAGEQNK